MSRVSEKKASGSILNRYQKHPVLSDDKIAEVHKKLGHDDAVSGYTTPSAPDSPIYMKAYLEQLSMMQSDKPPIWYTCPVCECTINLLNLKHVNTGLFGSLGLYYLIAHHTPNNNEPCPMSGKHPKL